MRSAPGTSLTATDIPKWLAAVQAGQAFGQFGVSQAAVGLMSQVQLFNPAASGKVVLVRSFVVSSTGAPAPQVTLFNTALGTLVGNGVNLLSGGAAGAAQVNTGTNAAVQGTVLDTYYLLANTSIQPAVEWFAQLGAGQGLMLTGSIANVQVAASFKWIEQ